MYRLLMFSAGLGLLLMGYQFLHQEKYTYFSQCEKDGGTPVFAENTQRGWVCSKG